MSGTAPSEHEPLALDAEIENRHRQPDLCTIYNGTVDGADRMEQWVTAREGSFVDLSLMR